MCECSERQRMPRNVHTTDYYLLCFDVCFFVFSSFFQFIQLFKMTNLANAYCTAFSMCCQRRASNDERWVLYALFYLICFVLCAFFFSLVSFYSVHECMKGWRFFDLVDICTPKNSVRFHVFIVIAVSVQCDFKYFLNWFVLNVNSWIENFFFEKISSPFCKKCLKILIMLAD